MVKACKGYLTEDGLFRVWDQDRVTIINRIHDCLNLNRDYQDAFRRTKKRMEETPGEKPFDFSQLYIFGKFEAFCRRLEKVFGISLFKRFLQLIYRTHTEWSEDY